MLLLMRMRLAWPAARWPMLEASFPEGFKGQPAADNPWEATTLEWTTRTPVPHDSFGNAQPVVTRMPYEYSVPGAAKDFLMQSE
ncbi:MAG: hypothetical protein M3X11_22320 [Acidobacteriota bacterium]|nr:hypothetical protein [Acidobacteriota bacterium]